MVLFGRTPCLLVMAIRPDLDGHRPDGVDVLEQLVGGRRGDHRTAEAAGGSVLSQRVDAGEPDRYVDQALTGSALDGTTVTKGSNRAAKDRRRARRSNGGIVASACSDVSAGMRGKRLPRR
jgi:hypothetical protein